MSRRCSYHTASINYTDKVVFLVDDDGGLSMTNDAERVCTEQHALRPGFRVLYRDTMGRWDEMVHDNGKFLSFAPVGAFIGQKDK